MKINNIILTVLLLITYKTFCGKPGQPLDKQKIYNEIFEIFNPISKTGSKDFFKNVVSAFCNKYPNLENIDDNEVSKILINGNSQKIQIIPILYLIQQDTDPSVIEFFIKNNFSCCLKYNISLLHIAARYNRIRIIKYLINKDIDINAVDEFGQTALEVAKQCKNQEAQRVLEQNGALTSVRRQSKCESCIIL